MHCYSCVCFKKFMRVSNIVVQSPCIPSYLSNVVIYPQKFCASYTCGPSELDNVVTEDKT